jgi:ABC-type nitrate/sulfonate/bicarbonate transport system permease component
MTALLGASENAPQAAAAAAPDHAARRRERVTGILLRSVSIVGFFALWYAASFLNAHVWKLFNPVLLPPPHEVLAAAVELTKSGELPRDIAASLARVVEGFVVAAVLGVAVGTIVGRSRRIEQLLEPPLELLRPIPRSPSCRCWCCGSGSAKCRR